MAQIQYFLGGNTPCGFYSLYDELSDLQKVKRLYIIKGGAGCGKSTLMKKIAEWGQYAGLPVEYLLCSGDPHSLDGVIFPSLSVAIADGTAPHVVEAQCAGAVEQYVDLSRFYDHAALRPQAENILALTREYRQHYKTVCRCLNGAHQLWQQYEEEACSSALLQRVEKRAAGIIAREIKPAQSKSGCLRRRFLTGITHLGPIAMWETVAEQAERIYRISDSFGLAHRLLTPIQAAALEAGFDVISCPDPMNPGLTAHLIIPELSLAFVSDSPLFPWHEKTYRHLRLDAMAEQGLSPAVRSRMRFSRKICLALTDEAVEALKRAKETHDRLEALYNPHVNFAGVSETADRLAQEITANR